MGKGRPKKRKINKLTDEQRAEAYGMWKKCGSVKEVAREIKCEPKTIREIIKKRKETGSVKDRPRSGRPRKTSRREDRAIYYASLKDRFSTATKAARQMKLAPMGKKVSRWLVANRRNEFDLNGRVARKKPLLTEAQVRRRKQWALDHKDWREEEWKRVVFSDESPFTLFPSGGKLYVWRRLGEESKKECIVPTVKFGGGKIQVWGCFSYYGPGPLYRIRGKLTGQKYREILKNNLAPYMKNLSGETGLELIFQQDNDPKHTSNVVQNYLNNKQMVVLDWASQSPDMNPIEHAWKRCKDAIYARSDRASTLDDVFDIIKEEWTSIPLDYFRNLVTSMPNKINALIKAKGWHTDY
ncbi:MAG TPA: transposase [Candidatus Saccharimonadales bacterium]|nr:transposase [Candidatus Saccharimonadales bacterium]